MSEKFLFTRDVMCHKHLRLEFECIYVYYALTVYLLNFSVILQKINDPRIKYCMIINNSMELGSIFDVSSQEV